MYYQLHDAESEEILGTVKVRNEKECQLKGISHSNEVSESWDDFNRCEESENDHRDVGAFVEWNNENRVTQLDRIYLEYCQP